MSSFEPSPDGRRIAFTVNADGVSRLYLMDTRTGASRLVPNVPLGLIGGLHWHRALGLLGFTLSSVRSTGDAFSRSTSASGKLDPLDRERDGRARHRRPS